MKNIVIDLTSNIEKLIISEDSDVYGLLIPASGTKYRNIFSITFKKSGIKANILIKVVLLNRSEVVLEPKIIVPKTMKNIECGLKIECLSDTDHSKLSITPSMEVSNPNIKTKHSLTISTFNKEQMSYLLSRGIDKTKAKKILIEGFIGDIITKAEPE